MEDEQCPWCKAHPHRDPCSPDCSAARSRDQREGVSHPALRAVPPARYGLTVLMQEIDEDERLAQLSDLELIKETLSHESAEDLHVREMMKRIYPYWFEHRDFATKIPDPPVFVSVAIRTTVAHEVVAFSECHCGERLASATEVEENEDYRPCLWCAINAAMFRATKDPMYQTLDEPERDTEN